MLTNEPYCKVLPMILLQIHHVIDTKIANPRCFCELQRSFASLFCSFRQSCQI